MAYTGINKSTDYFNTVTYTGNASGQTISGVGHQPDFIWVKQRSDNGYDHSLHNSVSGLLKKLASNKTDAEVTNTDTITSSNADGFVLGADTAGPAANSVNQDTKNYVAWNWKANGAGSANTDGDINSTVSANTTAGFSIVAYTGNGTNNQTVGHGLGVAPNMVIIKNRDNGNKAWVCYHSALGATKAIFLEQTAQANTSNSYFVNTAPTNSLFTIGDSSHVNNNGDNHIAYCFADKKGYSKFGGYTGNGSTDGTFIYTGFKPAFLLWKQTNTGGQAWGLFDNKRDPHNFVSLRLTPDTNDSEGSPSAAGSCDFLSNGFKWRSDFGSRNGNGGTYIYMAFAEAPLVGSNNVPATAR